MTRENLTTGMMPEQDWSKLMDVSDERHQKVDDFGKTLFESLGSFSVDGVSISTVVILCRTDHERTSPYFASSHGRKLMPFSITIGHRFPHSGHSLSFRDLTLVEHFWNVTKLLYYSPFWLLPVTATEDFS